MKQLLFLSVTLAMIICFSCKGSKNISGQSMQKISFTSRTKTIKEDVLKAFLNIDTIQQQSGKGVKFSIELKNNSNRNISIRNVLDILTISLLNEEGKNVIYPYISKVFVNTSRSYSYESFNVLGVKVNGSAAADNFPDDTIVVPSGGSYEIYLSITKILKLGATKPYDLDDTLEIPKGIYRLILTIGLMEGAKSEQLSLPQVVIRYR